MNKYNEQYEIVGGFVPIPGIIFAFDQFDLLRAIFVTIPWTKLGLAKKQTF